VIIPIAILNKNVV